MNTMPITLIDLLNNSNTPQCINGLVTALLSDITQLVRITEITPHAMKAIQTLINIINTLLDFINYYVKYNITPLFIVKVILFQILFN